MMIFRPSQISVFALLAVGLISGCAEADLPTSFEEPPVREVPVDENPVTTPQDMAPSEMQDMPGDVDMPITSDMPGGVDMPVISDMPGGVDMPADMPMVEPDMTPDMDLCGPDQCTPNTIECRGANAFATCQQTIDGCWSYGRIDTCPNNSPCLNGECQVPPECVDNDNDSYGSNCAAGPDCDDTNRNINPDATEICDGEDNDCNNRIDDNIVGVGDMCSAGQGVCAANGSLACDGSANLLICNAQAGTPGAEICDGLDNNCDGQVDEGGICPCGDDPREPNNTLATGSVLTQDDPSWNFICDTDQDFYTIPSTLAPGPYAVILAYPVQLGELQLTFYRNGVASFTTALNGTDHTGIRFDFVAGDTHAFEVVHNGSTESFYRINLFVEDVGCTSNPDFFEHNDTINTASLFTASWLTTAYICADEDDWYFLGNVASGEAIDIETLFEAGVFDDGGDIDLELYGDPQGDGTYEVLRSATTSGDDEYLSHTTSHEGAYFLRVFAYDGISNPYEIRMTR